MGEIKIIVEKHSDGYVAYPSAMNGIVVGEGDSYEEAVADVQSIPSWQTQNPEFVPAEQLLSGNRE